VRPKEVPADSKSDAEWNSYLADLTDRRNGVEVILKSRWDALTEKPRGQYAARNSVTMVTGAFPQRKP